uniref:Uncharacterized protein n=1 Tax=Euplotes harpa TaxID=151035 RepID=A0A7S3JJI7_9SPIT|mmetsp:Transcript_41157/g.47382  ORF Transcript_41157/g.47382 Transcript_41157/m.47382 type:complete len:116 (+) Transcript_41157:47-394(+)|eukprot:CAMPEP_0168334430 /NCGR_PEP_ID=MMETSP0213-20121227/10264_1 /TAXON_ID=151035 /ORGANISM="Euplotes harpa, Strain FSP1.4" /LENGTH=115 /DNA_ID=CAMNT_0008339075 /DNA_START=49 /DNA_END=396 /DNA_ORIENTATION=+
MNCESNPIKFSFVEYCSCEGLQIKVETFGPKQATFDTYDGLNLDQIFEKYCMGECSSLDQTKTHESALEPLNFIDCKKTKKRLILQSINFDRLLERLTTDLELVSNHHDEVVNGK